ncbi:MAG TPA: DUF4267 domain-containing protein [Candidatus Tumulicola sp.]
MTALGIVGALVAVALALVGAAALLAPGRVASAYGLPAGAESTHGFVRATGIRDVVIAVVLGATVYFGDRPLLIVVAAAGVALSLADLFNAYHTGGRRWRREHVSHLGGIVAFVLVLTMALFAIGM